MHSKPPFMQDNDRTAGNDARREIHGSQKRTMNAYDRMPGSQKKRLESERIQLGENPSLSNMQGAVRNDAGMETRETEARDLQSGDLAVTGTGDETT